jgi:dethiobiotin synthetase
VLRGLFVTGTDTGIGKTIVSAALLQRYRALVPLRYWKPIQTGIEQDDDTAEVMRLATCREDEIFRSGIRLPLPVSPHLAAARSGTRIDLDPMIELIEREPSTHRWIVEGAGGVLVPINERETIADLMAQLQLPVVVVVRTKLGTINHTLLTLETLRRRMLQVAGVVMVGEPNADNREAIERYGEIKVLGEMPYFNPLTPIQLTSWAATELDRNGSLLELMR